MYSKSLILLSDKTLVEKFQSGNDKAFESLYSAYWQQLYAFAGSMVRDHAVAEDLVQDVFVSLWLRRNEVCIDGCFHNYLYTAVRYRVISYLRKRMRQGRLQQFTVSPSAYNPVIENQSGRELQLIINQQVQKLPARMKQVFLLSRNEYLTHKEISDTLRISGATVKKQIGYALKVLRGPVYEYLYAS